MPKHSSNQDKNETHNGAVVHQLEQPAQPGPEQFFGEEYVFVPEEDEQHEDGEPEPPSQDRAAYKAEVQAWQQRQAGGQPPDQEPAQPRRRKRRAQEQAPAPEPAPRERHPGAYYKNADDRVGNNREHQRGSGAPIILLPEAVNASVAKALMGQVLGTDWPRDKAGPFRLGWNEDRLGHYEDGPAIFVKQGVLKHLLREHESNCEVRGERPYGGVVFRARQALMPHLVSELFRLLTARSLRKELAGLPASVREYSALEDLRTIARGVYMTNPDAFDTEECSGWEHFVERTSEATRAKLGELVQGGPGRLHDIKERVSLEHEAARLEEAAHREARQEARRYIPVGRHGLSWLQRLAAWVAWGGGSDAAMLQAMATWKRTQQRSWAFWVRTMLAVTLVASVLAFAAGMTWSLVRAARFGGYL